MDKYKKKKKDLFMGFINFRRLSAHKLKIETGRYNSQNEYRPPEERLCTNCNLQEIENEIHFLIRCPKYEHMRNILFENITTNNLHFSIYNDHQQFVWLLTNDHLENIKYVASFIKEGFNMIT